MVGTKACGRRKGLGLSKGEVQLYPQVNNLTLLHRGKVRDSYVVDAECMLLVASDRVSAFDCVLPNGIPDKGRILAQVSAFWFDQTAHIIRNHLVSADLAAINNRLGTTGQLAETLAERTMLVRRAQRIDIECVVRGYLAGSGWTEYKEHGTLAELPVPTGLRECEQLSQPVFTPAIKNDSGHDQNISIVALANLIGSDLARRLAAISVELYTYARDYARTRGIIIADTKFEFGFLDKDLILIDELLTPDSSRFWPVEGYTPGRSQPSFDKQPIRDYLAASGWDKQPPAPALPLAVVEATTQRYRAALRMLTGYE